MYSRRGRFFIQSAIEERVMFNEISSRKTIPQINTITAPILPNSRRSIKADSPPKIPPLCFAPVSSPSSYSFPSICQRHS